MQRRRCLSSRVISDTESESDQELMKCLSCLEEYPSGEAGTCKECYHEANETEEELKREIEDLKAKVAFLRFWSPLDHLHNRSNTPCFTDVVLIASSDGPEGYAVPLPAHKAVLVSMNFTGLLGYSLM
uniref:BTB domain-containing protein n=1 Tax=Cucumis sativus TaxID=3659 RepID=A0A0A0K3D3_CUCSA